MADLIDRKATINYFVTYLGWYDECDNPVYDFDEKRKYITEFIGGVTPVDAVPVVHGHWIQRGAKKVCSVCEARICAWAADCTLKYCPNCGSRMNEKNDEQDEIEKNRRT